MDCNGGFLNQTGVVKVKRLCWNHILGNFRNYENSCSMVHLPDAFNLSFFLSYFQSVAKFMLYVWNKGFTQSIFTFSMRASNGNTRKMCEISSKLTINTQIRSHWGRSGTFTVNCQYIWHIILVFPLLTFNKINILKNNSKDTRTTYIKMILDYVPEVPTKGVTGGVIRSPPINILQKCHHC